MQRYVIHKPGGYEQLQLESAPKPALADNEVRIQVAAFGVNYADCVTRMGLYASAKKQVGWPVTPGFEIAGIVAEVGASVNNYQLGDRVIGVTIFNGYSSELNLPTDQVLPCPAELELAVAAGLPTVFLTAWFALYELAHPRPGSKVLIHSAGGGVGLAAIQLAKLRGCEVTAVVGSSHKTAIVSEYGADYLIDKSKEELWKAAKAISASGFDVILDPNGPSTVKQSYAHLAQAGRLVVYGAHSMLPKSRQHSSGKAKIWQLLQGLARTPRFSPLEMTGSNRSVMGFNLSYFGAQKALLREAMSFILTELDQGNLRPLPTKCYAWKQAAKAQRDLESGQTTGKLVVCKPNAE